MLFYLDPAFLPQTTRVGLWTYLDAGAVDKFIGLDL